MIVFASYLVYCTNKLPKLNKQNKEMFYFINILNNSHCFSTMGLSAVLLIEVFVFFRVAMNLYLSCLCWT